MFTNLQYKMIRFYKYIYAFVICFFSLTSYAQIIDKSQNEENFIVRGSVVNNETNDPIANVAIEVNTGKYTRTDNSGQFRVQVKIGDQLIIRHSDFNTVYYTIKSNERIQVRVKSDIYRSKNKSSISSKEFKSLIDSVDVYFKENVEKSIDFIGEALKISSSKRENAEAYEVLADIYFEWKQFDLAISNYKISLQNEISNEVSLKLAKAYNFYGDYDEGIDIYLNIDVKTLSNWQLVVFYEGIGDLYFKKNDYEIAISNYKKSLAVAEQHKITPKITDLNSKIAKTYDANGEQGRAKGFFNNALNLAAQESEKREVEEKVTVADFQNKNRAYNQEIKLRKQILQVVENIELDSVFDNESALTPQKQNYKIGNAYALQENFEEAIPYFEKSIEEANNREDILIEKEATKKLAEAQRDAGDTEAALSSIKKYEILVDELYIKKEQEISRAARISKDLITKQNRILSLVKDRELSESNYQLTEEQNKNQKIIIYSLIGGLFLLLMSAYAMIKYIKQQQLTNNLLALKSLRSQMNPHFIFNALNSVNSFIATSDERSANKYLSDFSLLMRAVLENSEESFISLEKEIELLQLYTKLEHSRFKDKFEYSIVVDKDVKVEDFQIPPMLLQPYIENAVWHGLRYKKELGYLNITISQREKDKLEIVIIDNGIGREKSKALKTEHQQKQNSKGMSTIKKRVTILNKMYKNRIDINIDDYQKTGDIGTKVVVTIKKN